MNLQVRGIGGSGKSMLVRKLMVAHGVAEIETIRWPHPINPATQDPDTGRWVRDPVTGKVIGVKPITVKLYRCDDGLHVLGVYDLDLSNPPSTGGDRISGPQMFQILGHYMAQGLPHVLWESKYASGKVLTEDVVDLLRAFQIKWATLNTPLDVCIANTYERNGYKPFDVEALAESHRALLARNEEARAANIPNFTLLYTPDYELAYARLHDLLRIHGWNCQRGCEVFPHWDYR